MKLHFVSLGCPKNSVDLETILGGLTGGIELVDDQEAADVALVNTCAFITSAKQEAVETILQLAALKEERPGLVLLVSGCL
ncbi:MAG TPA: 30S ribosomal protein S12 methylthiotransferase RimO, partial [bacterium]|nr:30S ribosomal protein S12 methylthiotransferase RimO [bacterium]